MSATNLTNNLKLPQFVASDKPSWLGDVNGAMLKIDNGYGTLSGDISKANDTASSAKSQSDANTQTLNNVNSELESQGNRITALEAGGGTEQLEQRVNTLSSDVESLQTRADTFEEEIAQNGTNITNLTKRVTTAEGKIKTNEDNITSLTATTNGLSESVQSASSTATQAKTNADLALTKASSADNKATTAQTTAEGAQSAITNLKLNGWELDNHTMTGSSAKIDTLWVGIKGGNDNSTTPKTMAILPFGVRINDNMSSGSVLFSIPYNQSWTPYEAALGTNFRLHTNIDNGNALYFYLDKDPSTNKINVKLINASSAATAGYISINYIPPILFNIG